MNSRDFQTYDDYLDYKLAEKKDNRKKVAVLKDKNAKAKKNKLKKLGIRVTAFGLALITSIVALASIKKNKNKVAPAPTNSIVSEVTDDNTLDSLGIEFDVPVSENTKKEYGNATGNVDKNAIVKDDKGTNWAKETAKDNSNNVGKVVTNTNNGQYKVQDDGKVVDKNTDYEVKDETGKVVDSGTLPDSGILPGYSWDAERNEYVKTEDVGKYVYNDEGVLIAKGSVTKTETSTPSTNTTQTTVTEPTKTTSGYEFEGLIFETKADFEQWVIQGYEGYAEVNGIMKPETEEMKSLQKVK